MRTAVALVACLVSAACHAQACPRPADMKAEHMLGLWRATIQGVAQEATLMFEKHPSYADSVAGDIVRGGVRGLLSGEVDNGEFSMEESADGQRIWATWVGEFVDGSCGREIHGTWQRDGAARGVKFVMKKVAQ